MRPKGKPRVLEARRKKAVLLLKNKDMKPVEVARLLGVDRRSVRRWKAAYRQGGIKALKAKPAPGRYGFSKLSV